MDYRVRREPSDLESTAFIEIGPGKYAGKHWQSGFLFVSEDAFGVVEAIVAEHVARYDHFAINDIPRDAGLRLIAAWRGIADRLPELSAPEAYAALHLASGYRVYHAGEVMAHQREIAGMLRELADACAGFYDREEWICILGI